MRVCAAKDPIEVEVGSGSSRPTGLGKSSGHRTSCWLHGPEAEVPPGGTAPLERGKIAIAEEA